jgi:YfiH family protein
VELPTPFRAAGAHIAIDLGPATALFTTRRGGVSEGPFASLNLSSSTGDDARRVTANRERLADTVGAPWKRFAAARQVHGTRVLAPGEHEPEADGHVSAGADGPALVLAADCLPIALGAPGAAAMIHGGWRGLAGGIVAEGVRVLRAQACPGAPVVAAIGPGIGPCCYEVGDEVRRAFHADLADGRRLDLKAAARRALEAQGVAVVHDAGLCTACHPELFFSHRRDRGVTGRQAGVAWPSG